MIPRHPFVAGPSTVHRRDLDVILDDFYSHVVSNKACSVPTGDPWDYALSYIQQLYRVSHPYMTPDIAGTPPRPAHQEIFEEEWARDDYTPDLLLVCQRIAMVARDTIERGGIVKWSPNMAVLQTILLEALNALGYRRQLYRGNIWIMHRANI